MLKKEHIGAKSHGLSRQPEWLCLDQQGFVSTSVLWSQLPHGTGDPHDRKRGGLADHNLALTWNPGLSRCRVGAEGADAKPDLVSAQQEWTVRNRGAEFIEATIKVKWYKSLQQVDPLF